MGQQTFDVDKKGMAKVFRKRGLHRAIEELISNAQDEDGVTKVDVFIEAMATNGNYQISVVDDAPEGFRNLAHAYTIFAPSYKKDDPTKRGRFNFGEKWVIAICKEAKIVTTKGGIFFDENGRHTMRSKRDVGTLFSGIVRSNKEEIETTIRKLKEIIPNEGTRVSINGEVLEQRKPIASFEADLPTIRQDEEGNLTKTVRKTTINIFAVHAGEEACIYELGIPIVKTGDIYHYDVRQKVPLGVNRDNVPPSYLRKLRTLALDHTYQLIPEDKTADTCVKEALENASPEAVAAILDKQYGEKRAIFDPSDPEANVRLAEKGYAIMAPRSFDKGTWSRIKEVGAAAPSGVILPTPKPYDPNGTRPPKLLKKKTPEMEKFEQYAKMIAKETLGIHIHITWINDIACHWGMCFGETSLDINVGRLGYAWFENHPATSNKMNDLLIHELGHHPSWHHRCEEYYNALTEIGAKMVKLALQKPELFKPFM